MHRPLERQFIPGCGYAASGACAIAVAMMKLRSVMTEVQSFAKPIVHLRPRSGSLIGISSILTATDCPMRLRTSAAFSDPRLSPTESYTLAFEDSAFCAWKPSRAPKALTDPCSSRMRDRLIVGRLPDDKLSSRDRMCGLYPNSTRNLLGSSASWTAKKRFSKLRLQGLDRKKSVSTRSTS